MEGNAFKIDLYALQVILRVPKYSTEVLQALEGENEELFIAKYDNIIDETAKAICTHYKEMADGLVNGFDSFQNRAVYPRFCSFLEKKFPVLATRIKLDDFRREQWRRMKQVGQPPLDWDGSDPRGDKTPSQVNKGNKVTDPSSDDSGTPGASPAENKKKKRKPRRLGAEKTGSVRNFILTSFYLFNFFGSWFRSVAHFNT